MQGRKFEHNINVRRDLPAGAVSSSAAEEEESPFMWLDADTLWDWQNKRTYVLDPTRNAFGRRCKGEEETGGTPSRFLEVRMGTLGTLTRGRRRLGRPSGPRIRSL